MLNEKTRTILYIVNKSKSILEDMLAEISMANKISMSPRAYVLLSDHVLCGVDGVEGVS